MFKIGPKMQRMKQVQKSSGDVSGDVTATTTPLTNKEVESWIESHPEWMQDYLLRKADLPLVNKWLLCHGYHTVQEYVASTLDPRRGSKSQESSGQTSPDPRFVRDDSSFFSGDKDGGRHQRSNSKKHLRHDFARAKMRSIFRTHEASFSQERETTLAERRSSLKGMRQFLSLPPTSGNMLSMLIESKVRLPRYTSKDEQLKRQLRVHNERDFFLEIVKDISHDLDLKSLTTRILVNLCILAEADRSSLFFVEGPRGKQSLVSKVFDVCTGTSCLPTSRGDNIVRIPWGQGIIGHVAESGKAVNISQANQDPRYQDDVDRIVGTTTQSLLCMPIRNGEGEVLGVAQVTNNRTDAGQFTVDDEKNMEMYLAFCGMAISNAEAIESYSREYDRNKALLEVVHDLFEEQTSVDGVVMKIMQRAQTLLKCERCVVMLRDSKDQTAEKPGFSRVFDLQQPLQNGQMRGHSPTRLGRVHKIAEIVASTGETVNITDANLEHGLDLCARPNRDDNGRVQTKSILCKPIKDARLQTIGVAQLINKIEGAPFDENDDQLFEAFTIFCGLGISNCIMYDQVAVSAAKQAVALEVLSYHATEVPDNIRVFKHMPVPDCGQWRLNHLDFNDFSLDSDQMILASIRIFKNTGFLSTFNIDYETLVRWLLTVRKNYRNIAYHNWRHAFNVCQFMFTLLTTCSIKQFLSEKECLALIVACLCHDLDHRGTNNAFQQKSSSPLSQLYGTQATLEHHHFNHAVIILNSESHNIFANLSSEDYSQVMKLLKQAILATDLSLHLQVRSKVSPLVEAGQVNWSDNDQRELLRNILMTTCDIAAITKPWDIQRKVADLVVTEFFDQGDKEKKDLKIQPLAYMDREKQDELPKLQMDWIDGVCYPLYQILYQMDAQFKPLLDNVLDNRSHWELMEEERLFKSTMKQTQV